MSKKLTPEEKAARDARRAAQVEESKGKKRTKLLTVVVRDATDPLTLHIVASENDGLRTAQDVAKWMGKSDRVGVVYPIRIYDHITRFEQKKMKTIIGGDAPEDVVKIGG